MSFRLLKNCFGQEAATMQSRLVFNTEAFEGSSQSPKPKKAEVRPGLEVELETERHAQAMLAGFEKDKTQIKKLLDQDCERRKKACAAELEAIRKKNPQLSPALQQRLVTLQKAYLQEVSGACIAEYMPQKNLSVADIKNDHDEAVGTVLETAEKLTELRQYKEITSPIIEDFTAMYEVSRDSIMLVYVAEDVEKSKNYVTTQGEPLLAELSKEIEDLKVYLAENPDEYVQDALQKKQEQYARFQDLYKNTLATIDFFKDSNAKDAAKRAFALAHFADAFTSIDEHQEPKGIYLEGTLAITGYKRDDISLQLENIPRIENLSQREAQALGKVYAFDSTEFRMDGTGVAMATLAPFGMAGLVDTKVYIVKNEKGEDVEYIRVRFNSKKGPIGFMPKKDFDFEKVLADPREEPKPVKNGEEQPVALPPIPDPTVDVPTVPVAPVVVKFEDIQNPAALREAIRTSFLKELREKFEQNKSLSGFKTDAERFKAAQKAVEADSKYTSIYNKVKKESGMQELSSWMAFDAALNLEIQNMRRDLKIPDDKPEKKEPIRDDNFYKLMQIMKDSAFSSPRTDTVSEDEGDSLGTLPDVSEDAL